MLFTPDYKKCNCFYGGKIWSIPVQAGVAPTEIHFEVDVNIAMGPRLYFEYENQGYYAKLATSNS